MISTEEIASLIVKKLNGSITSEEELLLKEWENQSSSNSLLLASLQNEDDLVQYLKTSHPENWQKTNERIKTTAFAALSSESTSNHRLTSFRKWRWAVAALLILAIGSGIYYLNHQSYKSHQSSQITVQTKEPQTISPGTSKAILTFSNGTQKQLSVTDNGLQLQSNAVLLTTPRGGQYQSVLPDGSKVWLNAASSIRFPSAFNKKERKVEITGEVYFEIAKDASKPFKVYGNGQQIEVLGTSFNVQLYDDEIAKTSLIEGLIKVNNTILHPGKAYVNGKIITTSIEQDLAWKNNLFNFNGMSLRDMSRQLERWYDIKVKFDEKLSNIKFEGEMDRGVPLMAVLNFFSKSRIQYRFEGRTLILSADK